MKSPAVAGPGMETTRDRVPPFPAPSHTTRAIIRATPLMALRLEALKFGRWWAR